MTIKWARPKNSQDASNASSHSVTRRHVQERTAGKMHQTLRNTKERTRTYRKIGEPPERTRTYSEFFGRAHIGNGFDRHTKLDHALVPAVSPVSFIVHSVLVCRVRNTSQLAVLFLVCSPAVCVFVFLCVLFLFLFFCVVFCFLFLFFLSFYFFLFVCCSPAVCVFARSLCTVLMIWL